MILEVFQHIDDIVSMHIVRPSIIYGILNHSCHEVCHIVVIEDISKVVIQPRYSFSKYIPNTSLDVIFEDSNAQSLEFAVLLVQRVHFDAESARSDHVDGVFRRQLSALDDRVFGHRLVQFLLQVLGTLQQQVKHFLQLSGREDRREPRS